MQEATWQTIAGDLAARIESGDLGPGARIEPETQLAHRWKVSRHVAHRAMTELQKQGLVVRQRRWGTVVASRGKAKPRTVGYLVDFAGSRFQADIMMHIEHELDAETRLVVSTSKNDPEREAESLKRLVSEVDGIICYPADGDANAGAFLALAASGYPLVLVDRAPRGCEDLVVLTDNISASAAAVQNLVDKGHKRIAFFGSTDDRALSVRERHAGYRTATSKLGYDTRPHERWIPLALEGSAEGTLQSVNDALTAMRVRPDPPTAAFCVQDWLAMGVVEACHSLGLSIGTDFDIATFNDYGAMFLRHPGRMTRVLQQVDLISVSAVERLNALMAGEVIAPGPVRIPAQMAPAEEIHLTLSLSSSGAATASAPLSHSL